MPAADPLSYYPDKKIPGYYKREREEMLAYIPEHVRSVLDIGCGAGGFGRLLKERRAAEVWGVEYDPQAAERASNHLDRVFVGLFPQGMDLPRKYFDCVVFNDVLEHMIDPWGALEQTHELLTNSGYVVASVPNVRYLTFLYKLVVRGEWTYVSEGLLDKTHLRFFTKKSMLEMFHATGYETLRIEGIYPNLRWQVKALQVLFPKFVGETKYLNFAILAKPM